MKAGDRVKVVAAENGSLDTDLLGETGTVMHMWDKNVDAIENGVSVLIDPEFPESHEYGSLFFYRHELEVIE